MIEFSDVGLRYGNGPEILRDLTFSVEPGSFHFLTGPSGAGKTSLLRLLLLSLKPGITGAWQVSGRSALPYPQRAVVELEYVEGWSLWRDLRILLRTIPVVLAARGAH